MTPRRGELDGPDLTSPSIARSDGEQGGWPEAAGGFLGCLGAVGAWATSQGLAAVDPTVIGRGVIIPTDPLTTAWIALVALTTVGVLASGGRPAPRSSQRAVVASVSHVICALALAVVVVGGAAFSDAFYFTGPGDHCALAGCWPMYPDLALRCAPALLTAVALVSVAILRRRMPWLVRVAAPAALYLALTLAQRIAWDPLLVPWFQGRSG